MALENPEDEVVEVDVVQDDDFHMVQIHDLEDGLVVVERVQDGLVVVHVAKGNCLCGCKGCAR